MATRFPAAPVAWESGDATIVTVNGSGLLIAQGPGTAQVRATAGEAIGTAAGDRGVDCLAHLVEGNGQTAAAGRGGADAAGRAGS